MNGHKLTAPDGRGSFTPVGMGGASFSLQHRLQPMSKERRLKPALQAKARATRSRESR